MDTPNGNGRGIVPGLKNKCTWISFSQENHIPNLPEPSQLDSLQPILPSVTKTDKKIGLFSVRPILGTVPVRPSQGGPAAVRKIPLLSRLRYHIPAPIFH